jgi:hypothetical protein
MTTTAEIAERLAETYWLLLEREDPTLEGTLDALFNAVADSDRLAGGITTREVRALLDGPE